MNWIKSNAAMLTLVGVAILVFYVIKQSGGVKQAVTNAVSPAQPATAATV